MTATLLETLEQQGISFALNHDHALTLTVDQSLTAYPDTALTAELAELIKANKLEIIRQLRARANQYARLPATHTRQRPRRRESRKVSGLNSRNQSTRPVQTA